MEKEFHILKREANININAVGDFWHVCDTGRPSLSQELEYLRAWKHDITMIFHFMEIGDIFRLERKNGDYVRIERIK